MSDFDKEAEREKLRKRFEKDEQEREATQRMSDLLLKGATMTNKHCDQCRSPIFRQNGEAFCPSCQQSVQGEEKAKTEAAEADTLAETADSDQQPEQSASTANRKAENAEPQGSEHAEDSRQNTPELDSASSPATQREEELRRPKQGTEHNRSQRSPTDPALPDNNTQTNQNTATATLPAARSALSEALQTHAQLASQTTDPQLARQHLEAAREAAAALDTLPGQ